MCSTCAAHKEARRDASNHAVANKSVRLGTAESKKGSSKESSVKPLSISSEQVPDEFPFLKLAIASQENGTLQGEE